jgi:hypothetical protein
MGRQKSAEAIVVGVNRWAATQPTHRRRAELFEPPDAEHSMSDSRRRPKAEMPERRPRVGGGTAEGKSYARQTDTACDDYAGQPVSVAMEEVLNRENMLRAYHRVVANKGAAGVDGITVDELAPLLRERWEVIREELLSGQYVPNPVRKVEIPKPGGKGVRVVRSRRYFRTSCSMSWTGNWASRASLRPLCRRCEHLCTQPPGRGTGTDHDRTFPAETSASSGQSREECRGPALETQVPGIHVHDAPAEAESGPRVGQTTQRPLTGGVPTRPGPKPRRGLGRTPARAAWLGVVLPEIGGAGHV